MAWFTSTRERRLWRWTATVLAAIYVAAVAAGSLVEAIGSDVLLGVAFTLGFVLAVATVLGMALGRPSRMEGWVALGVAVAFLMVPVRLGVPPLERTHLFEYGLLATLLYEALSERGRNGSPVPHPALAAIAAASLFGWLDEAIQHLLPGRVYDLRDVAVNGLAAVVAVASVAAVRWLRARRPRRDSP